MAYMSREERRCQIMNAVVDIVTEEGLAAATVRRIALELECSPGQIHHHFASAEALRAEAVREVWERLEEKLIAALRAFPPRERLGVILSGCNASFMEELEPMMSVADRLWKEAWDIRKEPAVREAVAFGINKMRNEVVATLKDGIAAGIFRADIDVESVAFNLIAATQGFDLMHEIEAEGSGQFDKTTFVENLLRKEGI